MYPTAAPGSTTGLPRDWTGYKLDLRLAWRPTPDIEVSAVAVNVLKERHVEERWTWLYKNSWVMRDYHIKVRYGF